MSCKRTLRLARASMALDAGVGRASWLFPDDSRARLVSTDCFARSLAPLCCACMIMSEPPVSSLLLSPSLLLSAGLLPSDK